MDHKLNNDDTNRGFILVPYQEFKELQETVNRILDQLTVMNTKAPDLDGWVSETEAKQLLKKKTTWFHIYGKERLGGVKRGRTWWYHRNRLKEYIENGK